MHACTDTHRHAFLCAAIHEHTETHIYMCAYSDTQYTKHTRRHMHALYMAYIFIHLDNGAATRK